MLTPELQQLKAQEPYYEPSAKVRKQMGAKTLIALIGPTAVGKSTIVHHTLELGGADFSEAYSAVTRPRRSDDPAEYRTGSEGFTIDKAIELIREGGVTNYSVHPSGNIYASTPESFPARYNLLPLLPGSLPAMKKAGFAAVHAVYIVTHAKAWATQLAMRRDDPSFQARLEEADKSLSWAVEHANELTFIENTSGEPRQAAAQILELTHKPIRMRHKQQGIELVHDMLDHVHTQARHP